MTIETASPRIAGLDGLRALAVLMVFLHHKVSSRWELGELGVKIFFVISGYLIVGILNEQRKRIEAGSSLSIELKSFWVRRARRLFPVYYATLAFVSIGVAVGWTTVAGLPWYWLFLNNFFMYWQAEAAGAIRWMDAPTTLHFWTLAIEQQFYLLVSVLLLSLNSTRHRHAMSALIAVSLMSFASQALFDPMNTANVLLPTQNLLYLAGGALLRLCEPPKVSLLWLSGLAAFVVVVMLHRHRDGLRMTQYVRPALDMIVAWCLVAHVVRFQGGRLVRLLAWRPLVLLGTVSYGFYVLHLLPPDFDAIASRWLGAGFPPVPRLIWALAQFAVTLALAAASWRWLERPLIKGPARRENLAAHSGPAMN